MGKHFEKDIWKPLLFCNGKYQISRTGKVKSVYSLTKYGVIKMTGTVLKCNVNSKGYVKVDISWLEGGKQISKNMSVHRLVASAFVPNTDNKPEVNHKDLNKQNNDFRNLEWVTAKENTIHAHANGVKKCAFTKDEILSLRERVKMWGLKTIATQIGVDEKKLYRYLVNKRICHGFNYEPIGNYEHKLVIDINTGVFYYSIKELSELIRVPVKTIVRRLNGERPNNTQYRYA